MDTPATYVHWLLVDISVPNLQLIALMFVVFAMALLLPFPHHGTPVPASGPPDGPAGRAGRRRDGRRRDGRGRAELDRHAS